MEKNIFSQPVVVVERTVEEVQHLLSAEAKQADPPCGEPSAESSGLPF